MLRLSVNVNKVATLRNSRGGSQPNLLEAVDCILDQGVRGITVHPRSDERHITRQDTIDIARRLEPLRDSVEYNIEGDPRPDLVALVKELRPHQFTLVPVRPGEITSEAGWNPESSEDLRPLIQELSELGIRISVFIEPEDAAIKWAQSMGAKRVELYTEPYAKAFAQGKQQAQESFERYSKAAQFAHDCGLEINGGHDLDLENLVLFRQVPHLAEVSIGHAIMSRALFVGLPTVVREYLEVVEGR